MDRKEPVTDGVKEDFFDPWQLSNDRNENLDVAHRHNSKKQQSPTHRKRWDQHC